MVQFRARASAISDRKRDTLYSATGKCSSIILIFEIFHALKAKMIDDYTLMFKYYIFFMGPGSRPNNFRTFSYGDRE